jgi:hypothetical protein
MICDPCKIPDHGKCKGDTWCDCQHQPPGTALPQTIFIEPIASAEEFGEI